MSYLRFLLLSVGALSLLNSSALAFVCIAIDDANPDRGCIRWFSNPRVKSFLGAPPRSPLLNGTDTWDDNSILAANDWNALGAPIRIEVQVGGTFNDPCGKRGPGHMCDNTGPDGDNPVFFANDFCGRDFGDMIEVTNNCYRIDNGQMVNAPVFVNATVPWNAYDGAIRFDAISRAPIYDIRRVILHEFGHVLGLSHPPDNVPAIMRGRVSHIDRLQQDDIDGLYAIYGGSQNAPAPTSGCQLDPRAEGHSIPHLAGLGALFLLWRRVRRQNSH